LFSILGSLRFCDKRDMAKDCGLYDMAFESLAGRFILMGENWTNQDITDEVFMLYQSINRI
jgi:hypothetical protein